MPLLEGVYASAVTPRRLGVQDINLGAMWELIDFLCDRRVNGIVLLGSTGEFVHFSPSERMRMMGLAPRRSRVPVIVNVSHSTLDGAVELGQAAASSGAAGVLLMPPTFYRYGDDAILTFFQRFADEADIPIPILMYHLPQCTNGCSPEVFSDLLRQGIVHGIKDSSGNRATLEALLALRREQPFTLMVGNENLTGVDGVSGMISGVACALPELMTASCRSAAARTRIAEFMEWIERLPVPVGIKEAVALRGLKPGPHAVPLSPAQERIVGEFREWFRGWLPQTLKECESA
jgi:dihydrodipicolinate synthase/N-acetylneuraminate lyase